MNTLVAVAIAPFGVGDELAAEVAEVVKVIRESGLPNKTYSMFTEIEGEWDAVMKVVKEATFVLAEKGIRTEVILKADIRPGYTDTMHGKTERLEEALKNRLKFELHSIRFTEGNYGTAYNFSGKIIFAFG